MAPTVGRLTALKVGRLTKPGMHPDGGGLYLQVTGAGAKSWVWRFMLRGRAREMGLGSLSAVSLHDARIKAGDCRRLSAEGLDPIEVRRAAREQVRLDAAKALTFKAAAAAYISAHRPGWKNSKHAAQWPSTLARYAEPVIGSISVQAIDTALVLKVLQPIWATKPETASRLRGRIEAILDWASAHGYRKGENPARWRGHLNKLLPSRAKVRAVKHHAALPYGEVPEFMATLRAQEGIAARALELTLLTGSRTAEILGARWGEMNFAERVWTIPSHRMKTAKEHRVPLSTPALAVLERLKRHRGEDGFVFPGGRKGRPLSNMAMTAVLRRMGRGDLTVHGFRSSFRDWGAECTTFPTEVAEMALAHAVGNKVEAAYRRGDLFEKRRKLMDAWGSYCDTPATATRGAVVVLGRAS